MNFLYFIRIYITTQTNVFLHFLRKIPFVRRWIPEKIFRFYRMKKYIAWAGILFDAIKQIISCNLSIYVFVDLAPKFIFSRVTMSREVNLCLFFLLFGFGAIFSGSTLFRSSSEDQMFIHHFMVNPVYYYKYKTWKAVIQKGLLTFPILIYIFEDVYIAVCLMLFRVLILLLTNVIYLEMLRRRGRILHRRIRQGISASVYLLAYVLCFYGVYQKLSFPPVFFHILLGVSLPGIFLLAVYHQRYDSYVKMAIKYADSALISISVSSGYNINEGETGLKSRPWKENKEYFEKNQQRGMAEYLDTAFQTRFRKVIWDPIINNFIVHGVILLLLGLAVRMEWISFDESNLFSYSPILISLTLNCSFAMVCAQRYFRNIDMFILRTHMGTREYIRSNMLKRYWSALLRDIIVLGFLALDVAVFIWTSGITVSWTDYWYLIAICPPVLIIQDTYDWLVYYLIQPYAVDMTVKSPVFTVLGYVNSLLSILFLFIRTNITSALPLIVGITLASVLLFIICSNFAYKTFKLRL